LQHNNPSSHSPKRRPPTAPVPKISGTNNVPIARSRYQTSAAPISDGTDEPRQDPISESQQPLPNTSGRQTRHERSAVPERVSNYVCIASSIPETLLPQAQIHVHELPDRPPPYQGPPALERRESNRSRHEVGFGPGFAESTSNSCAACQ